MRLVYTLKSISGTELFARFAAAIKEDGVGHDNDGEWGASLSGDGRTWTTNWSRFTYTILNPDSDEGALVVYTGGWRGFLAQNLIPEELRGETIDAAVIEGSALERHEVDNFVHTDATLLAKAYGLMQSAVHHPKDPNRRPFQMALTAIEAADCIRDHLKTVGVDVRGTKVIAAANTGKEGILCENGDPAVYVTCCPGGEQVRLEIRVHSFSSQSTAEGVASRATRWIDRLKPVLDLVAI